jgi:hypothetical protein
MLAGKVVGRFPVDGRDGFIPPAIPLPPPGRVAGRLGRVTGTFGLVAGTLGRVLGKLGGVLGKLGRELGKLGRELGKLGRELGILGRVMFGMLGLGRDTDGRDTDGRGVGTDGRAIPPPPRLGMLAGRPPPREIPPPPREIPAPPPPLNPLAAAESTFKARVAIITTTNDGFFISRRFTNWRALR